MSAEVTVQLILTGGAIALALLGYLFGRRTRHVTAEVTLSVQAMEWAKQFEDRARNAEARSERAEVRATRAEQAATNAAEQAEECQIRMDHMERHIERLEAEMRAHGLEPPPKPPELRRS